MCSLAFILINQICILINYCFSSFTKNASFTNFLHTSLGIT
jgi:hypothetical protein